ncbi:MAG: sigma-E factor negative regulatory protein [Methylococcaceae bacterium]
MNEELNTKISQFIDDELGHDEALSLLQKMQSQSELIHTMNRYEAISHALKTDVFLTVSADFSANISQQIQQEPHYFLPQRKFISRNYKIAAVAASIAVIAVVAGRTVNNPIERIKTSPTFQIAQQQLPRQASKPVVYASQAQEIPLNIRINDYLQAHNSSVYTNGEATVKSLTRVTAYGQE